MNLKNSLTGNKETKWWDYVLFVVWMLVLEFYLLPLLGLKEGALIGASMAISGFTVLIIKTFRPSKK